MSTPSLEEVYYQLIVDHVRQLGREAFDRPKVEAHKRAVKALVEAATPSNTCGLCGRAFPKAACLSCLEGLEQERFNNEEEG